VSSNGEIKAGQLAFLTPDSVVERREAVDAAEEENYPIVMTFTYGDPLDEEVRTAQEQKQLRESPVGQIRGRIGFDYGGVHEAGGLNGKQVGLSIASDISNIGGTYWNFKGYWRGNMNLSSAPGQGATTTTLTDLINRTYHLGFYYQSPYSPVTIGVGRLFVPWAPSLSTIDGGYFGRKITRIATVGFFAGSTPDPTSWSYNPNQRMAGTFVNFEVGDFEHTRFYSTAGIAVTSIQWKVARQFAFFENNLTWKRYITLYSSLQADEANISAGKWRKQSHGCLPELFFAAHSAIPPRGVRRQSQLFPQPADVRSPAARQRSIGPVSLSRLQRGRARRAHEAHQRVR